MATKSMNPAPLLKKGAQRVDGLKSYGVSAASGVVGLGLIASSTEANWNNPMDGLSGTFNTLTGIVLLILGGAVAALRHAGKKIERKLGG